MGYKASPRISRKMCGRSADSFISYLLIFHIIWTEIMDNTVDFYLLSCIATLLMSCLLIDPLLFKLVPTIGHVWVISGARYLEDTYHLRPNMYNHS